MGLFFSVAHNMSQVIISHASQVCHGNLKYDAAISHSSLTSAFSTIYTPIPHPPKG